MSLTNIDDIKRYIIDNVDRLELINREKIYDKIINSDHPKKYFKDKANGLNIDIRTLSESACNNIYHFMLHKIEESMNSIKNI